MRIWVSVVLIHDYPTGLGEPATRLDQHQINFPDIASRISPDSPLSHALLFIKQWLLAVTFVGTLVFRQYRDHERLVSRIFGSHSGNDECQSFAISI